MARRDATRPGGGGTSHAKRAPERQEPKPDPIYRPQSRSYRIRKGGSDSTGEFGFVHTPEGTVIFTISPTDTYYEAIIDGKLHTMRELASRPARGAKIKAAQWLTEVIEKTEKEKAAAENNEGNGQAA